MNRIAANLLTGKTIFVTLTEGEAPKPAAKVYGGTPTATVREIRVDGKGLVLVTDRGDVAVATAKKTLFVSDVEPTNLSEQTPADEPTEAPEISDEQEADNTARMAERDAAGAAIDAQILADKEAELDEEPATEEPATETPAQPAEKAQDTPEAPKRTKATKAAPPAPSADQHPLVQLILTEANELHTLALVSGPDRQRYVIKNLQTRVGALLEAAKLALTDEDLAAIAGVRTGLEK